MEKQFEIKLEKWLENVATTCDKFANEIDLDFYPFQSQVRNKFNTNLIILGVNPGGSSKYKKTRTKDDLFNCGENGENAIIAYEGHKDWKFNTPLLEMFKSQQLRNILTESVIMNVVYFNTSNINNLEKVKFKNEIVDYCTKMTKQLIYDIIKPKVILVIGYNDIPKLLGIKVSTLSDSIIRTEDNKSGLIMKVLHQDIPHYFIHHTSRNFKFNKGVNLERKKNEFEEIFANS
jgi:hypothetical protein